MNDDDLNELKEFIETANYLIETKDIQKGIRTLKLKKGGTVMTIENQCNCYWNHVYISTWRQKRKLNNLIKLLDDKQYSNFRSWVDAVLLNEAARLKKTKDVKDAANKFIKEKLFFNMLRRSNK